MSLAFRLFAAATFTFCALVVLAFGALGTVSSIAMAASGQTVGFVAAPICLVLVGFGCFFVWVAREIWRDE